MTVLWIIVLCGALAIAYAVWAIQSVMKADAGNARMQEISAAVRVGAQAYLQRQYSTIAIVGVVIFPIVGLFPRLARGGRFRDRGGAVGARRLHRHERVGARQCAHRTGGDSSLAGGLDIAFKSGAITGMLVAGLGAARRHALFRFPDRHARPRPQ